MPSTALAFTHAAPAAVLRDAEGTPVPLTAVSATGRLEGLIFELTVEQRYENRTARNLEAVFTFPLPVRSVLLGFDLEIGDRKLSAVAVARREASECYEKAIDQGDTAALIEHNGHGLYTVSLGNLLSGETAAIRYRYAELLDAHDGYVRLNVPTVIAPRYGDTREAGLEGPSVPNVDLLGEYPFAIRLTLAGLRDPSAVRSPSHRIAVEAGPGDLSVALEGRAFLDRDFVLELAQAAIPTRALVARDGEGYVTLASATLDLDRAEQRPLALKILLDCSGSMGGDSIAAARHALLAILERLTPSDRVSLTRFGSMYQHVTEGLEPADSHTVTPLKAVVRQLDADLGGTEMERSLTATLAIATPPDVTRDLLLITDGEIYDVAGVVEKAAQSGHRLFAIAIGAAPVEALARQLAERTGGGCEFVGPGEDVEAAILRTFKRLRATPRTLSIVRWPQDPSWTAPLPAAVFPGDTLHLFAGSAGRPAGGISITVKDSSGGETAIDVPLDDRLADGDLLPRLAAARRIGSLDAVAARELAERYQLATEHTSFVVVDVRADGEKATRVPDTVAVPHMLAAGWGASSRVLRQAIPMDVASCSLDIPMRASADSNIRRSYSVDSFDGAGSADASELDRGARTLMLLSLQLAFTKNLPLPTTLAELRDKHGLPKTTYDALAVLCGLGGPLSEAEVVAIFLAVLASKEAPGVLDARFLQQLRGSILGDRRYRATRRRISRMVSS